MFRIRSSFSIPCLCYGVILLGLFGSISCGKGKIRSVTPCGKNRFQCKFSGDCISADLKCNGEANCDDNSDELDCGAVDTKNVTIDDCLESHLFKCRNGKCINAKWLCDDIVQCELDNDGDMSDELDCDTSSTSPREKRPALNFTVDCNPEVHWRCLNGQCIFKDWLCDGQPDCTDKSDEPAGCSLVHECPGKFKCTSGECIRRNWRCDDKRDCKDGSDEDGCTVVVDCPKENGKFLCKSGECINATLACNKKSDCKDGSDEFTGCESSCNKTSCAQGCVPSFNLTQSGFCYCNEGFVISGIDKTGCADINECDVFGTCSQFCTNKIGSYQCACLDGFKLDSNNTNSCVPESEEVLLVFGMKNSIRKYSMSDKRYTSIVDKSGTPVGVAYDSQNSYIYWTDVMDYQESIVRAKLDGSSVEVVVDTGLLLPEGIAFDWIAGNIYYTDSNNSHIGVCTSDGTKCTVVVNEMDKPRDIAVNPNLGYMFWTDWGKAAAIIRAGMDGSTPLPIVSTDLKWPNGLAIDHGTSRIYWNDANSDKIETTTFQGEDRQVVRSVGLRHPFGIDVFADLIIWSDWTVGEIQAANKFNGKDHTVLIKEPRDLLNGLVIANPANQPKLRANHCLNARCSHICTLTPTKSFRCLCPIGMKLDSKDRRTCNDDPLKAKLLIVHDNIIKMFRFDSIGRKLLEQYTLESIKNIGSAVYNPLNDTIILSDTYTKAIYEYKIKTKQLNVLVQAHIDTVKGMDIDIIGQNLYWVDTKTRTVQVMSLRTKARFVLFRENDRPVDVVVVPEIKLMFIAQVGQRGGKILKMSLNGYNRSVVIRIPNGEPTALTYHRASGHIFWLDSIQNTIEHASINGRNYYGAILTPGSPYGLTSFGNKIYWSDRYTQLLMVNTFGTNRVASPIFIGDQDVPNLNAKDSYLQGNFFAKISVISNDTSYAKDLLNKHECSKRNGCSHICLLSADDMIGTCVCPDGLQLDVDKKTCKEQIGCHETQFACHNEHCISGDWKCDGTPDCPEGEDEKNCEAVKPCRKSDFVCETDKICVPGHWRCDGEDDCHDGSDERNCTMKPCAIDSDFRCESGRCVPNSWRCDGQVDCADSSDERNCSTACPIGYIQCKGIDGSKCILQEEICQTSLFGDEIENPLKIKDEALESSSSSSAGTIAGIVFGVLLLVIVVLVIIVFILQRRNGHPKICVRPYVQQWVKYVNEPVQRYFSGNNRPEPLNGDKHLYDEVYHAGGGSTYSNPGYEEIDAPNNMYTALDDMSKGQPRSFTDSGILQSERNSLCEEDGDSHCISFNPKDRLINY